MDYIGSFCGMNLLWWPIWIGLLFWIFVTPYNIPGQRNKKDSPLYILQKRFASGHITNDEYLEKKKILDSGLNKSLKVIEGKSRRKLYAS